jgi:hypothetical protein
MTTRDKSSSSSDPDLVGVRERAQALLKALDNVLGDDNDNRAVWLLQNAEDISDLLALLAAPWPGAWQPMEKLRPYLQHKLECGRISHRRSDDGGVTFAFPPQPCTCGLADLLNTEPGEPGAWQPMEKLTSKTEPVLLTDGREVWSGQYNFAEQSYGRDDSWAGWVKATHWMPLPPLPDHETPT